MKKVGQTLMLILTLFIGIEVQCQTSNDKINSMKTMFKIKGDVAKDEDEHYSIAGAQALIYLRVDLKTITNISKLKIRILNTTDGSEVMNYTFFWDVTTGLPIDFSYNRDETTLLLGIGNYPVKEYDITIEAEDGAGLLSLPLQQRIYPN